MQKDIDLLEKIQKRAVKMIPGLTGHYEEKLKELGLTTLSARRERGDAIQTFKILQGLDILDYRTWFEFTCEVNVRSSRAVAEAAQARHRTALLSPPTLSPPRSSRGVLW